MKSTKLTLIILAACFAALFPTNVFAQTNCTPLPAAGADGRILYTAVEGDSQWIIAARFCMRVEDLRILNNLPAEDPIQIGQVLLLGLASEQEPTADPAATPEVAATTAAETPGTGMICVLLFEDLNGDALRQETELAVADGAASVSERTGKASRTGTTTSALDADGLVIPVCFEDLPIGEYTVSVAAPQGYNPTTTQSHTIQLSPGDATTLNFGAQLGSGAALGGALSLEEGGRSPLMGLLGMVLLLGGAGLGAYTWQMARRR
ncbi:MAG: LysM peptidoglycan-binding domain-containing protein [Anaerolineales bacterium]